MIERAKTATRESKYLDFKGRFDFNSTECWCELIKDIIAFANSGGGILVFGLESDGRSSGHDCSAVLRCDIADITNKIFKYTGFHFGEIETLKIGRGENSYPALVIGDCGIPTAFTKPGEYEVDGKKKSAFVVGSIYFRHGGKSEPGTRADIAAWYERQASADRRRLMQGVRTVVEAPKGATVTVVPPSARIGTEGIVARLSSDPKAIEVRPLSAATTHPHHRPELLRRLKTKLPKGVKVTPHDIVCINRKFDVFSARPDFATKPHQDASPQYNDQYIEWIVEQITNAPDFLSSARQFYAEQQRIKRADQKTKKQIAAKASIIRAPKIQNTS